MKNIVAFIFAMMIAVTGSYFIKNAIAQESEQKQETPQPSPDPVMVDVKIPSFCGQTEIIFTLLQQTGFVGLFRGTYKQSVSENKIIFAYNIKDPSKAVIVQQNEKAGLSCIMMEIKDLEVNRKMINAIAGQPV